MSKYIDAEKLIAEINNRLMSVNLEELGNFGCHRVWAYNDVKDLIASLQQEQPEVEFEKEEFVGVAESPLKTLMTAETQMIKITKSKVVVKIRKK